MAEIAQKKQEEFFGKKERALLVDPLNNDNPVTVQILGVCSALAVTTSMTNSLIMAVAVTLVTAFSNLVISAMRNGIPRSVRMIVQLVVIATLVTLVEFVLKAYSYTVWKQLSVFIGLIITNCIVMGRLEAYAMANRPWQSFLDGIGNGLGYGFVLMALATFREIFGKGMFFGIQLIGPSSEFMINTSAPGSFFSWYMPNGLLVLPCSALFCIGIFIWIQRSVTPKLVDVS